MYELLSEIGLTRSEVAVYLAILDLGISTTGPIIRKAGIASGKAYIVLNKLSEKGLITTIVTSGPKKYKAENPERLLDYLDEREKLLHEKKEQIKKIIPSLKKRLSEESTSSNVEVYEGVKGLKSLYESILSKMKKGECIDILGASRESEKFEPYFMDWNKRREKAGIKMRIIYNHDSREHGKKRKKFKLTQVRYMKQELETPAWVNVFQDYVATINVHGKPLCVLIRNKETADSYGKYFKILWDSSEK